MINTNWACRNQREEGRRCSRLIRSSIRSSVLKLLASAAVWAFCILAELPARAAEQLTPAEEAQIIASIEEVVILPQPIPDPIEPVNRGLWAFNKGLMVVVIQPTAKGYRAVVRKPIRRGISNFGENLQYPRRLFNNMFQGQWVGARDETARFLCNSVLGVAGFFDVATKFKIPKWETDFGETLSDWGWTPRIYLMLPIAGPSNERDSLGMVVDGLMNPLSYFPPYSYVPHLVRYNDLTGTVDDYVRVTKSDFDPYFVLKYGWTLKRESDGVDLTLEGDQDIPALDTLASVTFSFHDPAFPEEAETGNAEMPQTGTTLPFSYWLQPEPAPLVYVVPGLGSHRLSNGSLGLSELLYQAGYSVVAVSSAYNFEFIQRGLSTAMPGYTPVDAGDMHLALTEIDRWIANEHPGHVTARVLAGYSMGGFHGLFIAATQPTNEVPLIEFDRYLAINSPVRLTYAIEQLDKFFAAALEWPLEERTWRIEQTFLKVAALTEHVGTLTEESVIPLNRPESRFVIGLAFRLSLRDLIFLSQMETNMHILDQPLDEWRREPVYREILQYSFTEYLDTFVTRYYLPRGIDLREPEVLRSAVDLRVYTEALRQNPKLRLIENENDILLGPEDLAWLRETFGERLIMFPRGGHLGNLSHPVVQKAIVGALAGLPGGPAATPEPP